MFTLLLPGLPCSPPALVTISWLLLTALCTSSTLAPPPSLATLWRMWARLSSSLHSAACHHHHNLVLQLLHVHGHHPGLGPRHHGHGVGAQVAAHICSTQLGNYKTSSVQESFKRRSTRRFPLRASPD